MRILRRNQVKRDSLPRFRVKKMSKLFFPLKAAPSPIRGTFRTISNLVGFFLQNRNGVSGVCNIWELIRITWVKNIFETSTPLCTIPGMESPFTEHPLQSVHCGVWIVHVYENSLKYLDWKWWHRSIQQLCWQGK